MIKEMIMILITESAIPMINEKIKMYVQDNPTELMLYYMVTNNMNKEISFIIQNDLHQIIIDNKVVFDEKGEDKSVVESLHIGDFVYIDEITCQVLYSKIAILDENDYTHVLRYKENYSELTGFYEVVNNRQHLIHLRDLSNGEVISIMKSSFPNTWKNEIKDYLFSCSESNIWGTIHPKINTVSIDAIIPIEINESAVYEILYVDSNCQYIIIQNQSENVTEIMLPLKLFAKKFNEADI